MEFEKLKKIIAEVLNVDENEITEDTRFTDDLGADSGRVSQRHCNQGFFQSSPSFSSLVTISFRNERQRTIAVSSPWLPPLVTICTSLNSPLRNWP